ncbi:MAG: RNA polymerase sigma factor [Planctomycetota bacterium]
MTASTALTIDHRQPLSPAGADEARHARAVREHLRAVWRYLRMHGAGPDEADDLAQECFVIAAQKDALGLDPAATATFLRRTARFLFLRRRSQDHSTVLLADAVDELWARDCGRDGGDALLTALRRCLQQLAPRAARAVQMAYGIDGDEPARRAEIAAALGLQENGVKTLMQRAREQLRSCLDRKSEEP